MKQHIIIILDRSCDRWMNLNKNSFRTCHTLIHKNRKQVQNNILIFVQFFVCKSDCFDLEHIFISFYFFMKRHFLCKNLNCIPDMVKNITSAESNRESTNRLITIQHCFKHNLSPQSTIYLDKFAYKKYFFFFWMIFSSNVSPPMHMIRAPKWNSVLYVSQYFIY